MLRTPLALAAVIALSATALPIARADPSAGAPPLVSADAGPTAGFPPAIDIQFDAVTGEHISDRALDLGKKELDEQRRAANAALSQALDEQREANSQVDLLVTNARAGLESTRVQRLQYRARSQRARRQLADEAELHAGLLASVIAGEPMTGKRDPRFKALSSELARLRTGGLDALFTAVRKTPRAPPPPLLSLELRSRADDATIKELERLIASLEPNDGELERERRQVIELTCDYRVAASRTLTGALVRALEEAPELTDELRSLTSETADELQGETVQVALRVAYWARARLGQLRAVPSTLTYGRIIGWLWDLGKLIALLAVLWWALRRWSTWMQISIEAIGQTLTYGQAALVLVRLIESARSFGPPLLVLLTAMASYQLFSSITEELEIALQLIIAVAALRVQLRLIESGCERLEARGKERRQDKALLAAEAAEVDEEGEGGAAPHEEETAEFEPFWRLFARTWRRLTRYVAVFSILLVITHFGLGKGVFFGLLIRWAWIGAVPLTLFFLRTWRARIVHELTKRSSGGETTLLGRLAQAHAHRFYGLGFVFAAFIVVLGRRSAAFVKDHIFGLNSTKRVLAFLFRRRVQRHARETGRVLDRPHELPELVISRFSNGQLERVPLAANVLAEIIATHESWWEDSVDGSVAVVGDSGMGKTSLLSILASELGAEVEIVELDHKITKPAKLCSWLAEALKLDGSPNTERQLVAALRDGERRIVAIDDCHHLFLRQVGGFEAWEAFTRVVNDCGGHIFWVLTFSKAAWDYLENVGGHVAYFRRIVHMPRWTETELRRLILRRMRLSGYQVNFSDLLVTRLEGVEFSSQIIRTSQGYFRLLWDYSNGNPSLASFFWLRSLVPDEDSKSVRVHLFAAPRIQELEALPDDIAFVLTAIIEHESANAQEISAITNLPKGLCSFAVRYGRERGYLSLRNQRVSISPLWRQTITTYLKRKHLLYS